MKTTSSFNVQIWCGLRSGYEGSNMNIKIAEENSNEPIDILQLHTNGHPSVIKMYNENFLKYNELIKKIEDGLLKPLLS